jgi:dienelactone hydrolase
MITGDEVMEITRYEVPGAFGDRKVIVEHMYQKESRDVFILFHGVHGTASGVKENKYGNLGRILVSQGARVYLVETSRIRRDRDLFGNDRNAWAWAAFEGKTYGQDLFDNCSALSFILDRVSCSVNLWGFSLGGLHSIIIRGGAWKKILSGEKMDLPSIDVEKIKTLITSGSGDSIRKEASNSLALPILSTVPEADVLHGAARNITDCRFISFYGENDRTFTLESCRRIFDLVPLEERDKSFNIIEGADHSFREIHGEPSSEPLGKMVSIITDIKTMASLG